MESERDLELGRLIEGKQLVRGKLLGWVVKMELKVEGIVAQRVGD